MIYHPQSTVCTVVPDGAQHPSGRRPRIALYSHDTMGLGHLRRNALIGHSLARSAMQPIILSIAGKSEAGAFPVPPDGDRLILPALQKANDGRYRPATLGLSLEETIAIRSRAIEGTLAAFEPDLFIVDNVPRGARGELDGVLRLLRANGRTRCVLGLRDVLDDPDVVEHEWRKAGNEETIRRYYDAIWVYGNQKMFDVRHAYHFAPALTEKMQFTGYFDQLARLEFVNQDDHDIYARFGLPDGPLVLCLIGGGQDGGELARAFAATELPSGWNGIIVTGPYLPHEELAPLHARAERDPRFRVVGMIPEPLLLIKRAARVIAMGGYNSVSEILSCGRRSLIIPRVRPRIEQLLRAQRLAALDLVEVLHADSLSAARLSDWLGKEGRPHRSIRDLVALDGLGNICDMAAGLLGRGQRETAVRAAAGSR